jgi:hypothetical protein
MLSALTVGLLLVIAVVVAVGIAATRQRGLSSGLEVLTGALRPQTIELESEWFNQSYRVLADDPRFAHAVVHPRMMELLLQRGEVPWRIDGADLIGWAEGPLEMGNVLRRIAVLSEVAGLIPPFVFTDYGRDPRLG